MMQLLWDYKYFGIVILSGILSLLNFIPSEFALGVLMVWFFVFLK